MAGIFIPYRGGQGAPWTNVKRKAALDRQRRPSSMVGKAGDCSISQARSGEPWRNAAAPPLSRGKSDWEER